jgi:ribonucleotide monophosphatase NagD (HAD superfamily)
VITSPQAAMRLLEDRVEPGALVFVVGGEGIVSELEKRGFRVTRSAEDGPRSGGAGIRPRGRLARARGGIVRV